MINLGFPSHSSILGFADAATRFDDSLLRYGEPADTEGLAAFLINRRGVPPPIEAWQIELIFSFFVASTNKYSEWFNQHESEA